MSTPQQGGMPYKWICLYLNETEKTSLSAAKRSLKTMNSKAKQELILKVEQWMKDTGKSLDAPSRPRGRPIKQESAGSKPYSVNLPVRDIEMLKEKAEERGESVSVLIRAAIRAFLIK